MSDAPAPVPGAVPSVELANAEPVSLLDKHVAAIRAKPADGAQPTTPVNAEVPPAKPKGEATNAALAMVRREREATKTIQAAKASTESAEQLRAKYDPLEAALAKKDLKGAMTLMKDYYGVGFEDFVEVLTSGKNPDQDPREVARAVAAEAIAKAEEERSTREKAAKDEGDKTARAQQEKAIADAAMGMADAGGERWQYTAISGRAADALEVILKWHEATCKFDANGSMLQDGERLTLEQALDKIETKLKGRAEGLKAKSPSGAAPTNGRSEAASQQSARAAFEPSFTNRSTLGTAPSGAQSPRSDEPVTMQQRLEAAARKVGIKL